MQAAQFKPGQVVEYYSTTHRGWIPGIIQGFDDKTGTYSLDVQPIAFPNKVRACSSASSTAMPPAQGVRTPQALPALIEADEATARSLQQEYEREAQKERRENILKLEFNCPLCLEQVPREGAIELDCLHRLCPGCFRAFLQSKIANQEVADDELKCPLPKCSTPITVAQVQGATVGTPFWDKFLEARANLWRPRSFDGKLVACPRPECEKFVVPADTEIATCPKCRQEFCAQCGQQQHRGSTCEMFQAWQRQNNGAEQDFEELMAKEQWKRCPVCKAPSERESGCNFMQCRSSVCRKRTYWCYICGTQLPLDDHYTHFPKGPYQDVCILVGPNGQPLDPEALQEEKYLGQPQPMRPAPGPAVGTGCGGARQAVQHGWVTFSALGSRSG